MADIPAGELWRAAKPTTTAAEAAADPRAATTAATDNVPEPAEPADADAAANARTDAVDTHAAIRENEARRAVSEEQRAGGNRQENPREAAPEEQSP